MPTASSGDAIRQGGVPEDVDQHETRRPPPKMRSPSTRVTVYIKHGAPPRQRSAMQSSGVELPCLVCLRVERPPHHGDAQFKVQILSSLASRARAPRAAARLLLAASLGGGHGTACRTMP